MNGENADKIFKFILKCLRTSKPDLHSFVVSIDDGKAFVNCEYGEVWVNAITYDPDGNETRKHFAGTAVAAANYLIARNADYYSIEQ